MINANEGKNVVKMGVAITNAASTHSITIDTKGADQYNAYIAVGSHDTDTAAITDITVSESDTVTSASSQTAIAALSSGTVSDTATTNVLPLGPAQGAGGIVNEIQIDLRKRKRYVGITVSLDTIPAGMPIAIIGRETRNEQSKDSATQKAGLDIEDTNLSGCMAVITA
jgi:hypothetical protein